MNTLLLKYNTPTGGYKVSHKTKQQGDIFHIQIEAEKPTGMVTQAFAEHEIEVQLPNDCDEIRLHYPNNPKKKGLLDKIFG